eukprot:GEMP01050885.1.p2 GENE.GEMP01050885.1~~GEMP01050885.1.p2  ORF type:complete len:382 (+),score=126.77 GEMP01050885.1:181-1326(+)
MVKKDRAAEIAKQSKKKPDVLKKPKSTQQQFEETMGKIEREKAPSIEATRKVSLPLGRPPANKNRRRAPDETDESSKKRQKSEGEKDRSMDKTACNESEDEEIWEDETNTDNSGLDAISADKLVIDEYHEPLLPVVEVSACMKNEDGELVTEKQLYASGVTLPESSSEEALLEALVKEDAHENICAQEEVCAEEEELCSEEESICAEEEEVCTQEEVVCAEEEHVCAEEGEVCGEEEHVCAEEGEEVYAEEDVYAEEEELCAEEDVCAEKEEEVCMEEGVMCGEEENVYGEDVYAEEEVCVDEEVCAEEEVCADEKVCAEDENVCVAEENDVCVTEENDAQESKTGAVEVTGIRKDEVIMEEEILHRRPVAELIRKFESPF